MARNQLDGLSNIDAQEPEDEAKEDGDKVSSEVDDSANITVATPEETASATSPTNVSALPVADVDVKVEGKLAEPSPTTEAVVEVKSELVAQSADNATSPTNVTGQPVSPDTVAPLTSANLDSSAMLTTPTKNVDGNTSAISPVEGPGCDLDNTTYNIDDLGVAVTPVATATASPIKSARATSQKKPDPSDFSQNNTDYISFLTLELAKNNTEELSKTQKSLFSSYLKAFEKQKSGKSLSGKDKTNLDDFYSKMKLSKSEVAQRLVKYRNGSSNSSQVNTPANITSASPVKSNFNTVSGNRVDIAEAAEVVVEANSPAAVNKRLYYNAASNSVQVVGTPFIAPSKAVEPMAAATGNVDGTSDVEILAGSDKDSNVDQGHNVEILSDSDKDSNADQGYNVEILSDSDKDSNADQGHNVEILSESDKDSNADLGLNAEILSDSDKDSNERPEIIDQPHEDIDGSKSSSTVLNVVELTEVNLMASGLNVPIKKVY